MSEEFKGKMKEAYGAMTGDEGKKAEGQAQQRAATAAKEAGQKERTRQEQAKEAEKERDRQARKDKGILGNVGDTLSGR
ncbi:MAG: CsbD family protein [Actinomycetota bacterium]|nr:CsbD family protein [Actinomycetota bacterium]